MSTSFSSVDIAPDWEAFLRCLRREGTPSRPHFAELFLDAEVQEAIVLEYGLVDGLDLSDPFVSLRQQVKLQRFLGYDYVRQGLDNVVWQFNRQSAADTAALGREGGRSFVNESVGPITTWDEFERYPWPDPSQWGTASLEWLQANLPDDMCIIGSGGFGHFSEHLTWLMGYETMCIALYDQPDLVQAISERIVALYHVMVEQLLQFDRVKIVWASDDMGFRTGTLISPDHLRTYVLPGHKLMAEMCHATDRLYLLHSCGNTADIMPDLINDVQIDGKHSFEDVIESVVDAKHKYGDRIAVVGGMDMDFMCRASEVDIRRRVRETLSQCQPGGGYCLGTGNSVANYVPLPNYLAMLDEGRKFRL